jgi:glycerol-3-phosphate dehydrogenase
MNTPAGISTLERDNIFNEIPETQFDILIIGGGIMGAGIALDAASRGFKVLLAEKQDFASGTSSRSTKLIHGGLRYLKNLEFNLVRAVASERKILHQNAPHLVLPEPMLIPILEGTSYGYWPTKAGLTLYDFLGNVEAPERHRMLTKKQTLQQDRFSWNFTPTVQPPNPNKNQQVAPPQFSHSAQKKRGWFFYGIPNR